MSCKRLRFIMRFRWLSPAFTNFRYIHVVVYCILVYTCSRIIHVIAMRSNIVKTSKIHNWNTYCWVPIAYAQFCRNAIVSKGIWVYHYVTRQHWTIWCICQHQHQHMGYLRWFLHSCTECRLKNVYMRDVNMYLLHTWKWG